MTRVTESSEVHLTKKKSLLERFDLPLHHLDFDYVKKCRDVKELEKILRVLRSKEEGYYPELESCTESQLALLDGKNRLLRKGTKVMTKASLSTEEWNNITSDLLDWKGGVERKNSKILESKCRPTNGEIPNIRSAQKGFQNTNKMTGNKNENPQRIRSLDYKSWEAFNAEEECKKMDVVEEKKMAEVEKAETASKRKSALSTEELAIKSLGSISNLSQAEREVMAVKEKDIGNEYYRTNKVEESIKHYTRSIHLHSTIEGLNNRAAAYLKQCAFNKALDDLNQALKIDPKNIKARFRRAQSYQHKNLFNEALDDINEVLVKEPNHLLARHIADQLRSHVSTLPKKHRIKIRNKETGKFSIISVTEKEMLNDYKDEKFIEVNEWGFPKIMCNCNGKHTNYPGIRHEDHVRYQHLKNPPSKRYARSKQNYFKTETSSAPVVESKPSGSGMKLEIVEVEKGAEEARPDSTAYEAAAGKLIEDPNWNKNDNLLGGATKNDLGSTKIEMTPNNLRPAPSTPSVFENPQPLSFEPVKNPVGMNPMVFGTKKVAVVSPTRETNSCVIADMRVNKTASFPNDATNKCHKTNINDKIKDTSASSETVFPGNLPVAQKKEVKTDKNIIIQENGYVNQMEPNQTFAKGSCECQNRFASFQFKKEWNAVTGSDSLQRKAALLKSICPKHLVDALGNYWEKEMLVDVVKCLLYQFNENEQNRVVGYVKALPKLERFNIISNFLDQDEKSLMQELVKSCSLNTDSNIIDAFH